MRWRRRTTSTRLPITDPIIADAHFRQAEAERQHAHAQQQRPHVQRQRARAAELLAVSQDLERKNHFAEAIVKSMGRHQ